jgi:hypothetical protein
MLWTLVSYYGGKPPELEGLIRSCQEELSRWLGPGFQPYRMEQVHATLIGLEGSEIDYMVQNQKTSDSERLHEALTKLLDFLHSPEFPSFKVQIGGFRQEHGYSFTSRRQHPYLRTFAVQGEMAVAMGWPVAEHEGHRIYPGSLADLRWTFTRRLGFRHKWHRHPEERDNDFYFVLGRIDRGRVTDEQVNKAEDAVRKRLAEHGLLRLPVDASVLHIVGYLDPQLPLESSQAVPVLDLSAAERLRKLLGLSKLL